jgi:N-acetylmuramoyl-L-alanine amidase
LKPVWRAFAAWGAMLAGLCLALTLSAAAANTGQLRASGLSMTVDGGRTRISLHLDQAVEPGWFLLRGPWRLVIDLPPTRFAIDPEVARPTGLVDSVRYGHFDDEHSRIIFGSDSPFVAERIAVRPDGEGHALIIELAAASESQFEAQLAERAGLQRSAGKQDRAKASSIAQPGSSSDKPFTIVIDPGHGGIDGGARGVSGIEEKSVTLAFALELRRKLDALERFRVVMTRENDEFLRLRDRVRIARENEADLFISIHADTIRYRNIRGATVYTVSAKASDKMAAEIAESANLADLVAGIAIDEPSHEVSDILLDLLRRETQTFSIAFARTLVGELSDTVEMIKNPHRSAGFQVLTAPDVPSVLIELGYLSNPKDEEAMRDPGWRDRAADSIVTAILEFAKIRANGMGG